MFPSFPIAPVSPLVAGTPPIDLSVLVLVAAVGMLAVVTLVVWDVLRPTHGRRPRATVQPLEHVSLRSAA